MASYLRLLDRVQRPGLSRGSPRDRELADVVEQAPSAHGVQSASSSQLERLRNRDREGGDPASVAARPRVADSRRPRSGRPAWSAEFAVGCRVPSPATVHRIFRGESRRSTRDRCRRASRGARPGLRRAARARPGSSVVVEPGAGAAASYPGRRVPRGGRDAGVAVGRGRDREGARSRPPTRSRSCARARS